MSTRPGALFSALSLLLLGLAGSGCDSDAIGPVAADSRTFLVQISNVGMEFPVLKSGAGASLGGASDPDPAILPGETATFSFTAPANTTPMSGMNLNLATMFVQSNDLFYAFPEGGLPLFDGSGTPVTGDVTDQLFLYDAGTEINETPGDGTTQKPDQAPDEVNVGPPENGVVMLIPDGGTDVMGFSYPDKADVIQVTIAHLANTFTVTITNVSDDTTLPLPEGGSVAVPLSPFAWAAHTNGFMLYELGAAASQGIEYIAEDGFPADALPGMDLPIDRGLADDLADVTGVTVPLSPGSYAVHNSGFELHRTGEPASVGIERIAEDGDPAESVAALAADSNVSSSGAFLRPDGASEDGPIGPGGSYSFNVTASPGDQLSLATMFVQSNDLYYAFAGSGLALFDGTTPISGDMTAQLRLFDAGTEGDQEPGVGPDQVIRQSAADTGPAGEGLIVRIGDGGSNDGFTYGPNTTYIQLTITPQ